MGRKRAREESTLEHGSPRKKHKKNKHHHKSKHHKGKANPPITLKIKLGDKYISATGDSSLQDDDSSIAESEHLSLSVDDPTVGRAEEWEGSDVSVGKDDYTAEGVVPKGDDDQLEEEAWLNALESGQVDERGYLPAKRKSSALTARQRAMLGGSDNGDESSEQLMQLPLDKKGGEMTEEDLLKKVEQNQKRRLAAQKRKEKRKAETVRKLIEKQSTKRKDDEKPKSSSKPSLPHMRYINSSRLSLITEHPEISGDGSMDSPTIPVVSLLSLPSGMDYPLTHQEALEPPVPMLCAVKGCCNRKRYSDSVTKLPLCSLQCYKALISDKQNQSSSNSNS